MMYKKGFTLIELIIVITILGILAAAGFTNYTGSVKRAKDAKNTQNIEVIKTALIQYLVDNSTLPTVTGGSGKARTDDLVNQLIPRYLGNNYIGVGTKDGIQYDAANAGTLGDCISGQPNSFCLSFVMQAPDVGNCSNTSNSCTNCRGYCSNEFGRIGR